MPLDPEELYWAMESAYRHGVLDKLMVIQGEALVGALAETGLNIGDLLNKMDEADIKTVMKMERLLGTSAPMLRLARSDRLMKAASGLLGSPLVRRGMVLGMKRSLIKTITGKAPTSPVDRLKVALAGRSAQAPE